LPKSARPRLCCCWCLELDEEEDRRRNEDDEAGRCCGEAEDEDEVIIEDGLTRLTRRGNIAWLVDVLLPVYGVWWWRL